MIAPSFIAAKCSLAQHVVVAGDGEEDVADLCGFLHRHHAEAVHRRFERPHRIDFGDDHMRAHARGPHRDAPAAPAVAGDDEVTGDQDIGRAHDAVQRALARAVAIVEEVLGVARR